jgi:hypothetical protein
MNQPLTLEDDFRVTLQGNFEEGHAGAYEVRIYDLDDEQGRVVAKGSFELSAPTGEDAEAEPVLYIWHAGENWDEYSALAEAQVRALFMAAKIYSTAFSEGTEV